MRSAQPLPPPLDRSTTGPLGDVIVVTPLVDRLMHHGYQLKFDSKRWRLKESAARLAQA